MPRNPIYSDEEIIETGENQSAQLGRQATATDIHKALEGKGNYQRIRELWENHLAKKGEEQPQDTPLPDDAQNQISKAVTALEVSVETIVRGQIARMTEQTVRQFALRERDFAMLEAEHAKKVQALEEEIEYLTDCLDKLEAEKVVTYVDAPDDVPAQPAASEPAPAAAALAEARRSPNRPKKKPTPAPRKASRPAAPKPKQSPRPEQSPS
jgi:hypothetical protein